MKLIASIVALFWAASAYAQAPSQCNIAQSTSVNPVPGSVYTWCGPSVGAQWIPGTIIGPLSDIDSAIVLWDGPTGRILKDSALVWSKIPTAIAHSQAKFDNLFEGTMTGGMTLSPLQLGGIFNGTAYARFGFSAESSSALVGSTQNGIADTVYILHHANGLGNTLPSLNFGGSAGVGLQIWADANQNYDYVAAANFIASTKSGGVTAKINALELDMQPPPDATLVNSYALIINAFTLPVQGAIIIGNQFGGSFYTGILMGGLKQNDGVGLGFNAGQNGDPIYAGIDLHNINCTKACLSISNGGAAGVNGQAIGWESNIFGTDAARAFVDNVNIFHLDDYIAGGEMWLNNVTKHLIRMGGPVAIGPDLFATAPACVAGAKGWSKTVMDSNTAVYNAIVAGGGTNVVTAICDGTNWRAH